MVFGIYFQCYISNPFFYIIDYLNEATTTPLPLPFQIRSQLISFLHLLFFSTIKQKYSSSRSGLKELVQNLGYTRPQRREGSHHQSFRHLRQLLENQLSRILPQIFCKKCSCACTTFHVWVWDMER